MEHAEKMVASGKRKAERKNPNDPARFVGKMAVTKDGEAAGIKYYLDDDVAPYSGSAKGGGG